jgi:hypothetical protein
VGIPEISALVLLKDCIMPLRNEDVIRNVITYEAATFEN